MTSMSDAIPQAPARHETEKQLMPGVSARLAAAVPYERFLFHLRVTSLMVLPAYKGAVLRGAFGNTLKGLACVVPVGNCKSCTRSRQCLYVGLFEPVPPPDYPLAGKFEQAPPPFVLNPPLTQCRTFRPGEALHFELVLIGGAVHALPYIIVAFQKVGRRGLERERGQYEIVRVDLLRGEEAIPVFDPFTQTLVSCPPVPVHARDDRSASVNSLNLQFLTPLRLKEKGRLVSRLTFPLLFDRLLQRLSLLAALYGSGNGLPEFGTLRGRAQNIRADGDDLYWYDWERYSGRQQSAMKFGGLQGKIRFAGELGPFLPLLRAGESLNVGQLTTFGLGRYKIDLP